jgi:hypothetical protein
MFLKLFWDMSRWMLTVWTYGIVTNNLVDLYTFGLPSRPLDLRHLFSGRICCCFGSTSDRILVLPPQPVW